MESKFNFKSDALLQEKLANKIILITFNSILL